MARVLIVDDATFIREILKDFAKQAGWIVVAEADDGEKAVLSAMQYQPEVIFMDLVLPKMNGIEATKRILSKMPEVKIIATSTLDQEDILLRAIEAGCCSFVTKPFKFDQLKAAVNQARSLNI